MSLAPSPPNASATSIAFDRHQVGARFGRARAPFVSPTLGGAVPGFVVQALLQFADDRAELGDERVALRLTKARAAEHAVRVVLGAHVERALRLCLIWDRREQQTLALGEDEPPAQQRYCGSDDELWDEARAA